MGLPKIENVIGIGSPRLASELFETDQNTKGQKHIRSVQVVHSVYYIVVFSRWEISHHRDNSFDHHLGRVREALEALKMLKTKSFRNTSTSVKMTNYYETISTRIFCNFWSLSLDLEESRHQKVLIGLKRS